MSLIGSRSSSLEQKYKITNLLVISSCAAYKKKQKYIIFQHL